MPRAVAGLLALRSMPIEMGSLVLAGLSWVGLGACSDHSAATDGSDTPVELVGEDGQPLPEGSVECSQDPRVDDYVGLDKNGELGVLSFKLSGVEPAPPAKGDNTFHVEIRDAEGAPVAGDLHVDLKMPDHGHSASVVPNATFDPQTGQYTVTPLSFFMPGVWRIQLEAYAGATPLDRTAFYFCIQG